MKKVYVITLGHHKDGYNPFKEIVFDTYALALAALEEYKKNDPLNCFLHEKVWLNGEQEVCLTDIITNETYFTETRDMPETEAEFIKLLKRCI